MRVEFWKSTEKGRVACGWDAHLGKRRHVPGAYMAAGKSIPHDLLQYVVEASARYEHGFWGLIAEGATFKSTGRPRTKPGRAIIAAHRQDLVTGEALVGIATQAWIAGEASTTTEAIDAALEQWRSLQPGERLVFTWPNPRGAVA